MFYPTSDSFWHVRSHLSNSSNSDPLDGYSTCLVFSGPGMALPSGLAVGGGGLYLYICYIFRSPTFLRSGYYSGCRNPNNLLGVRVNSFEVNILPAVVTEIVFGPLGDSSLVLGLVRVNSSSDPFSVFLCAQHYSILMTAETVYNTCNCSNSFSDYSVLMHRLRGRVVKGVEHLDHV